ncbi:MAG: transcriptional regulator NrdR, partial [Limisphaerales bacterium]
LRDELRTQLRQSPRMVRFRGLRELDDVAYVRFASVYRRFQEATDFVQEVQKLEAAK